MSIIQRATSPKTDGEGVFLAVAAYGDLSAPFVQSLFSSISRMADHRINLEIFSGNCHVDDTRNSLVRDFLESDCEQLIFLDVDVFWLDADFRKLIEYDKDIVAGIYPMKDDRGDYPVSVLEGERWSSKDGLVEVKGVPTGFLKIRRKVLEALYKTVPTHRSKEDGFGKMGIPLIFERTLNGKVRRGGDYEFCAKARKAGFKIYVDPKMQLGHVGEKQWVGCIGDVWRKDVAIPEGLKAIKEGKDTPATYLEMYNVWGNIWALTPEAIYTSVLLARKATGTILECGSGLSSLCLAAATEHQVIALESSPIWACKIEKMAKENGITNLKVVLSNIVDRDGLRWFDYVPNGEGDYSFVLCDGPPRKDGRGGLFKILKDRIGNARILVDDIDSLAHRKEVDDYCKDSGREYTRFDGSRPFGLVM